MGRAFKYSIRLEENAAPKSVPKKCPKRCTKNVFKKDTKEVLTPADIAHLNLDVSGPKKGMKLYQKFAQKNVHQTWLT